MEKFNENLTIFILSILIAGWGVDYSTLFATFPGFKGGGTFPRFPLTATVNCKRYYYYKILNKLCIFCFAPFPPPHFALCSLATPLKLCLNIRIILKSLQALIVCSRFVCMFLLFFKKYLARFLKTVLLKNFLI